MVLNVHLDASYITPIRERSRAHGHFLLGLIPVDREHIVLNGAILILSTILKCVAASADKAELGTLFLNAQEELFFGLPSKNWGIHNLQPRISCENATAVYIVNYLIKRQRYQAINMRYLWLLCHQTQRILHVSY